MGGLNEAEARESASWRNSEIYLIEPWAKERAGRGDEEFGRETKGRDKLGKSADVLR